MDPCVVGECVYFIFFYCVGPPVRVNVSAGLVDTLLVVSPPLEVAPLLVVVPVYVSLPLEVAPLKRSRGFSVVQLWVQFGLGCKRGGSGGGVETDWGVSWACWDEPYVSAHA